MASIRRSGAKLFSLGSGHGNLVMTISQLKELRNATKSVISVQNDTIFDMLKWGNQESNRAIKDIVERFGELCSMWTEAQKQFANDLKDVRNHFEMILEGERIVDSANQLVDSAETKEVRLRKEHKKLKKKSCAPIDQLRDIEERITKVHLDKNYAESEATCKLKDHEAVKMIRLREALKKFSTGQLALCKKGQLLFEAGNDVIEYFPEISSDDIQDIKYQGSAATTQIVIRTKEKLKNFNENDKSVPLVPADNVADLTSTSRNTSPTLPASPPAYDEIHMQQPPVNPYYQSSPNVSFGQNELTYSPDISGLTLNSPVNNIYPDLPGRTNYDRRNSYHGGGAGDAPAY